MVYVSALVYWFLDKKPSTSATPFANLRKWSVIEMDVGEDVICEGLWTEKSSQKWIPCVVLRLDTGKMGPTPSFVKDLNGKGGKNDQPASKSTNQRTFTACSKAALKLTNQSTAAAKSSRAPASTQGISSTSTSLDDETTSTSSAPSKRTQLEPSGIEYLMEELRKNKTDTEQNTQLKSKFDHQVKKYMALESEITKKRKRTEEDMQILSAMNREKRDCYAIKAGMLELFSEDDLVYGVLSKQGLRNSAIARKQLDEEKLGKIEEIMKDWSAFRGKPELSQEKFRDKVGTILETAKRQFKKAPHSDNEDEEGAGDGGGDGVEDLFQ
ncbi:hypothetical protein BV898_17194 [Hypsibius exemplaris]|uniref:Uncharacterized protein n=1 Tax=Hypsibius exemplaris TaxID=2072580 RepID=A0A9X6NLV4_HYPEX|nr:hypothetical protein BV898_17194 [Hypsibius exemplaris]